MKKTMQFYFMINVFKVLYYSCWEKKCKASAKLVDGFLVSTKNDHTHNQNHQEKVLLLEYSENIKQSVEQSNLDMRSEFNKVIEQ